MRFLQSELYLDANRCTMKQKRCIRSIFAMPVCLTALLTGCGDSNEPYISSRHPAPVHACEILKASEVEAILGAPANKPEETHKDKGTSEHWMSMCIYYSEEKQIGMGISILPHGRDVTGEEAFVQHENELKGAFGDDYKQENVAGVGDYAGWDTTTKQLTIFQGPYMVIAAVNSVNFEDAEALDITRKFSRQFLAKLPK